MDKAVSNAKRKEPRSNPGTVSRLDNSFNPTSQAVTKPATITPKKISKKLLIISSILLSALDNAIPS
jgi:hypothetical protein